jgi:hypothetical protein
MRHCPRTRSGRLTSLVLLHASIRIGRAHWREYLYLVPSVPGWGKCQNINTHTRTHKIRAQSTQTNRDTEASSKASGERQPLPIIRESGAPCQRPAQTAGDRGGAPCSLPYSGGNNPRDSASKQASAHHNSRATSTRTATHAYHHHTTHAGCQSTGVGWPTRVNPHGRKKTRAQTARARPKPEVKRRGKPDRESGHVGTGGTLAAMRRGLDRERLEPT